MARTLDRAISTPFMESAANVNIAINGGMEVSQENGTTQITLVTATATKYIVDQWGAAYTHNANTAVFKSQQVTPPGSPAFGLGFPNCLQLTATTLTASAGAGDCAFLTTPIEGYRVAKLGFGSATNPQYVTVGFWVYATIAGTMAVALQNSAHTRAYITDVVINSATTWEYKTVTIPVDTTGTWVKDNGIGLNVYFCFGSGSTFRGTNNAWQATNTFATSSTTNFFASNNNTACITGVGIWPGTDAPIAARSPFAQRPYTEELTLCLRYYEVISALLNGPTAFGVAQAASTSRALITLPWKVVKRAAPVLTVSANSDWAFYNPGINAYVVWSSFTQTSTEWGGHCDVTTTTAGLGSAGTAAVMTANGGTSNARMYINARL